FIYIRATMGEKAKDSKFKTNWKAVKKRNKLRGAYHYFRPNENSIKQANNFIKTVDLEPGDLPPVLDIEEMPRNQSMDSLKTGLKRWLVQSEEHTSELQSRENLVCRLLLEKKKIIKLSDEPIAVY